MTKRTILDALLETGILSPQKSWPHLASMLVLTFRPEMEMGLAGIAKLTLKQNKIRDLFKVKLYLIRSKTKKKREREKRDFINPNTDSGIISDPN